MIFEIFLSFETGWYIWRTAQQTRCTFFLPEQHYV